MAVNYHFPANPWSASDNYRSRLLIAQNYSAETNTSELTITPQFADTTEYGYGDYNLIAGTIQYKIDGEADFTTLWDFSRRTSGGNIPYHARFAGATAFNDVLLTSGLSSAEWPISRKITVVHNASTGNKTVYFKFNGVTANSGNNTPEFTENGSVYFVGAPQANPVYIRKGDSWVAHQAYIYKNGSWVKHRPYIYKNGAWVPHG